MSSITQEQVSQGLAILEKAGALERPDINGVSGIAEGTRNVPAERPRHEAAAAPQGDVTPEGGPVQPFVFSDGLRAAGGQYAGGIQAIQQRQAQIQQAVAQLPDLERISPLTAIKRREEIQQAVAELSQLQGQVLAYGEQLGQAAAAEVRASAAKLIPEWQDPAVMQRESEQMISFAISLGLDEHSIERIAWNPSALARFHATWQRMRSLVPPKLKPLRGGKRAEERPEGDLRPGGAITAGKLQKAREIFRNAGVTP
jgi:hypothetical protein